MRFSLITLALSLATSVYAAAVEKRAISAPVAKCITDLQNIDAQLLVVNAAVTAFTSSSGYSGALAIHTKEQTLESLITTATTDCCAVSSATEEEALAVLVVVDKLVTDIVTALNNIDSKKPQFDAVLLATAIVKSDIKNLKTKTNSLDTCLLNAAPADLKTRAQGYINTINTAFATAYTVYGIA